MKHTFQPMSTNAAMCRHTFDGGRVCERDQISHTSIAECESCGSRADCEVYDSNMLMCWPCQDKSIQALMDRVDDSAKENRVAIAATLAEREEKELARIALREDVFNSEISSFVELRATVDSDVAIPDKEKEFAFHSALANRIQHYNALIWTKENELLEMNQRKLAVVHTLRTLANSVRGEIREQIRRNDSLYKPAMPKSTVAKAARERSKMSPLDRIAQSLAMANGITIDEARAQIYKNPAIMGTDKPKQ